MNAERRESGRDCPGCVDSRMPRSPKHSAGTPWLCPVAAPCPLPAVCRKLSVPLGCAPSCFAECKGLLTILPTPHPGQSRPLSRLIFANVTKKVQGVWLMASCFYGDALPWAVIYYSLSTLHDIRHKLWSHGTLAIVTFTKNSRERGLTRPGGGFGKMVRSS